MAANVGIEGPNQSSAYMQMRSVQGRKGRAGWLVFMVTPAEMGEFAELWEGYDYCAMWDLIKRWLDEGDKYSASNIQGSLIDGKIRDAKSLQNDIDWITLAAVIQARCDKEREDLLRLKGVGLLNWKYLTTVIEDMGSWDYEDDS